MKISEFNQHARRKLADMPRDAQAEVKRAAKAIRQIAEEYGDAGGAAVLVVSSELLSLNDEGSLTIISD